MNPYCVPACMMVGERIICGQRCVHPIVWIIAVGIVAMMIGLGFAEFGYRLTLFLKKNKKGKKE